MYRKTFTPVGALHPVLFFAGVYAVALIFSIFICSSIFYSCNTAQTEIVEKTEKPVEAPATTYAGNLSASK